MPAVTQHHARITNPDKYDRFTQKEIASGISQVYGWKGNTSEVQAYRFNADKFTPDQAKKWLKDHDEKYIGFDTASEAEKSCSKVNKADPKELEMGKKVEREHLELIKQIIADVKAGKEKPIDDYIEEIAKVHIKESPTYYSDLKQYVEKKCNKDNIMKSLIALIRENLSREKEEVNFDEIVKMLKEEEESPWAMIFKSEQEKQIAYGVVLEPMTDVTKNGDAEGDSMSGEEIEKTAHQWLEDFRKFDEEHSFDPIKAVPVESYLAPVDFTPENGEPIKKGSWIVAVKINDPEIWSKVKSGEYNAFSPGGFGYRRSLNDE